MNSAPETIFGAAGELSGLPFLYLDVDGVLNPLGDPCRDWTDWPGHPVFNLSRRMGARLGEVQAKLVWATTWQGEANDRIAPVFGWPAAPILPRAPEVFWWKFESLLSTHPMGVPFVWIDDELDDRLASLPEFDDALAPLGADYLLVCPDTLLGLTAAQIDSVEEFVNSLRP